MIKESEFPIHYLKSKSNGCTDNIFAYNCIAKQGTIRARIATATYRAIRAGYRDESF